MRGSFHRLAIAAAAAALAGPVGEVHADPIFEWEYSIDGGAFTTRTLAFSSGADAVTLDGGKLSIVVNYNSNNPGTGGVAELSNQITDTVTNADTTSHMIVVNLTETGFTSPSGSIGTFQATIGSVSVQQLSGVGVDANATVGASAYLDDTNTPFGTKYATNPYSQSASSVVNSVSLPNATLTYGSNPFTPGTPFSMTVSSTVNLGQNTRANAFNDATFVPSVPEPSSMAIAGLGALGMIGYGLWRRKAESA
jgi:hypothetical protein